MSTSRDAFLQRVRHAVAEGNRPAASPPLPERGAIGYQGAGVDPVACFVARLTASGGKAYVVRDPAATVQTVMQLVKTTNARRVLLGCAPLLERLRMREHLTALDLEVRVVDGLAEAAREAFFAADVGISGVDYLIAETGSLAIAARAEEPRSLSLLPPIHIAVAERSQLLPDLFDLFDAGRKNGQPLPSCLSLVTGPSKTGDIELRLVTGVHGPGELHVVLLSP